MNGVGLMIICEIITLIQRILQRGHPLLFKRYLREPIMELHALGFGVLFGHFWVFGGEAVVFELVTLFY